jgi:hypothetical protein
VGQIDGKGKFRFTKTNAYSIFEYADLTSTRRFAARA